MSLPRLEVSGEDIGMGPRAWPRLSIDPFASPPTRAEGKPEAHRVSPNPGPLHAMIVQPIFTATRKDKAATPKATPRGGCVTQGAVRSTAYAEIIAKKEEPSARGSWSEESSPQRCSSGVHACLEELVPEPWGPGRPGVGHLHATSPAHVGVMTVVLSDLKYSN